jgi:hypothetical protein
MELIQGHGELNSGEREVLMQVDLIEKDLQTFAMK